MFKSTDGGDNWSAIDFGLPDPNVVALAIDPSNPTTLNTSTFRGGVFMSTDGGGNWSAVYNTGLLNTGL